MQNRISCSLNGQKGSLLIGLIITMVIFAILSAATVTLFSSSSTSKVSSSLAMKAQYYAEAGGRYFIPRIKSFSNGTHRFKFSNGTTFFIIDKISNSRFTSTGVINEGAGSWKEVRVAFSYSIPSLFDYALFGGRVIVIGNNALVDSYSSSGQATDGENGNVGTNSDDLSGISDKADIHGEVEIIAGKDMTPPTLPAGADSWTDATSIVNFTSNNQTHTLSGGNYKADQMYISNNSSLIISGDVTLYVAGTANASNNSILSILPGASLAIYAGGNVDLSNNSLLNGSGKPADFLIYGLSTCTGIQLSNNSETRGAIYAPAASIVAGNNQEFYGAMVGDQMTLNNNGKVHYDEDLAGVGGTANGNIVQTFLSLEED